MKALVLDISAVRWMACKVLGLLTPAVYWSPLACLRYRDVAEPALPAPDWVKLRVRLGGICGTDLGLILQRNHPATILRSLASFPMVLGHENVAVVDQVGPAVTRWTPGTRVVVEPALSCVPRGRHPVCPPCREGCFSLCENFRGNGRLPAGTMVGGNNFTSGSWAPYFVAHESQLHLVPEEIPDEQAVLIDPIACSLHGVLRRPPADGERVLVQGGGVVGLGVVMALRALGHANPVTALVRHPFQAARLRSAGADETVLVPRGLSQPGRYEKMAAALGGQRVPALFGNQGFIGGVDLVYDCIGSGQSLTDAMKFCRPRGTVVALGTSQIALVDTTPLWFSEVTLLGAYGRQMEHHDGERRHTYEVVIDLVRGGKLRLGGLLTHVFDLADYRRAFRVLTHRGSSAVIKAAFQHRQ